MCAKHYENSTMLSRVTAKNVGDVFFWDTLYMRDPAFDTDISRQHFEDVCVCIVLVLSAESTCWLIWCQPTEIQIQSSSHLSHFTRASSLLLLLPMSQSVTRSLFFAFRAKNLLLQKFFSPYIAYCTHWFRELSGCCSNFSLTVILV